MSASPDPARRYLVVEAVAGLDHNSAPAGALVTQVITETEVRRRLGDVMAESAALAVGRRAYVRAQTDGEGGRTLTAYLEESHASLDRQAAEAAASFAAFVAWLDGPFAPGTYRAMPGPDDDADAAEGIADVIVVALATP